MENPDKRKPDSSQEKGSGPRDEHPKHSRDVDPTDAKTVEQREEALDDALDDSFPASDPPSSTPQPPVKSDKNGPARP